MDAVKDYGLTNKGLTISRNFLENAGGGADICIGVSVTDISIRGLMY